MRNIYKDGSYLKYNPTWHEEDSSWKADQIIRMISKNHLTPLKICEVGCGAGEILRLLAGQMNGSIKFIGYEISPQAFSICRSKMKRNLLFLKKDFFKETSKKYDLLMAIDVFEHVEDYIGFLKKLKGKGKYKMFHIPLDLSAQAVVRGSGIMNARKSLGHLHYFTKETALETLKYADYKILDYFYTAGGIELPNQGWKATLLKIPRKILFFIKQDFAVRIFGGFSLLVLTE